MNTSRYVLIGLVALASGTAAAQDGESLRRAIDDALARHPGFVLTEADISDDRGHAFEVEVTDASGAGFELDYDAAGALAGERPTRDRALTGLEQAHEIGVLLDTAVSAALAGRQGSLREVELDHDDGRWFYEVEVTVIDGDRAEVRIDPITREVVAGERD